MDPFSLQEEEEEEEQEILSWVLSSPEPFNLASAALDLPPPPPPPPPPPSAFVKYRAVDGGISSSERTNSRTGSAHNIHWRVTGLLRRIWAVARAATKADSGKEVAESSSRAFRHMRRERQRRERQSQGYADLHSILFPRSKGDKISIVQSAAEYLRELKEASTELQRRNRELEAAVAHNGGVSEAASLKLCVVNCPPAIDCVSAVLRCLKHMEFKATAFRCSLSGHDLCVHVRIETKVAVAELQEVMKNAMSEVENILRALFPQQSEWALRWHLEKAS